MTYPNPTNDDFAAFEEVKAANAGRITNARTRAEKWIAGLSALLGLVATVLIIKGPDSITKFDNVQRIVLALVIGVALFLLGLGVYCAYSAAYGDAFEGADFQPESIVGLDDRLAAARVKAEASSRSNLASAVRLTLAGIGMLVIAIGLTWVMSPPSTAEDVCIYKNNTEVARISADVSTPLSLTPSDGSTIRPCDT